MGFRPLPWVDPLECWSEPGHILVKEYDGTITDYPSTIKLKLPKQCVEFKSVCAKWVLHAGDSFFCGNDKGTYQQVRIRDNVLLSCGTWDMRARPRDTVSCGVDENGDVCELDVTSRRIVYVPSTYGAYLLKAPIIPGDIISATMYARSYPEEVVICTEKGVLDLAVSGSWVSPPTPTVPYHPIQL